MIGFRSSTLLMAPAIITLVSPSLAAAPRAVASKLVAPVKMGDVTRAQMIAQTNKTFDLADTNHDGYMSRPEFAARMAVVLNARNVQSKAEAQELLDEANRAFDNVDTNHDGKLSRAEAMVRPLKAFDMMDANHDGVLTVAEKRAAHENAPGLQVGPTEPGAGH